MNTLNYQRFSRSNIKIIGIATSIYLLWMTMAVGLRLDHIYFAVFFVAMMLFNKTTRNVAIAMIFFWIYWIIYDSLRVIPNHSVSQVHVEQPYNFELKYFGIWYNDIKMTLNEYFLLHQSKILDFTAGAFYLTWVPLPLAYCFYLYKVDRRMLLSFSACFLFTNLVGFVFYYGYPAAPPWYVAKYGFIENFSLPGDAAGLSRFDDLLGINIFGNMYNKNANVFAAIPSLHSAYPVVLFYFGLKKRYKILSAIFFIDIIGIWFAALYTSHHYLLDILLGGLCAIIAIIVFELLENKTVISKYLDRLNAFVSK